MNKLKLKFDTINMDTQLAKVFLRENEPILKEFTQEKSIKKCLSKFPLSSKPEYKWVVLKLKLLLKKVEENAELFAQLEALHNDVPKEETKNYAVAILIQHIKYYMLLESTRKYGTLSMGAFVAMSVRSLLYGPFSAKTEDLSYGSALLFIKLLAEVEICEDDIYPEDYYFIEEILLDLNWSCIGVVAERSDLDSAVDILLNSTTKLRCSVDRLFVQESVYNHFKKTVSWKCKLANCALGDDTTNVDKVSRLCSEAHVYREKLILFDYAGDSKEIEDPRHVIVVEAYRTVKELISLVAKHNPFALSLWASDTSEAQEIPQLLSVPVVWLNDFGRCDGPPRASTVFYDKLDNYVYLDDEKVIKSYEAWSKLTIETRKEKLQQALRNLKSTNKDDKIEDEVSQFEMALDNWELNQFVEIKHGRICAGIVGSAGLALFNNTHIDSLAELLQAAVHGTGFIYSPMLKIFSQYRNVFLHFESEGLPFYRLGGLKFNDLCSGNKVAIGKFYETRVIYTNFGTVFAN